VSLAWLRSREGTVVPIVGARRLAHLEDNLAADRHTPAAGDAIHAGICAKDAIVTVLTGASRKANAQQRRALTAAVQRTPVAGFNKIPKSH